jgi:hypothetical protein
MKRESRLKGNQKLSFADSGVEMPINHPSRDAYKQLDREI